jgi:polyisoprenoid-binding protein YceI
MTATADERRQGLVPTGTWRVDPAHSSVEFQVKHMMIATVKGRFTEFAGALEAGEDGTLSASGAVQAASVDTNDARRDEHLRSGDFFDAATHPELTFVSTAIEPAGDSAFRVAGELTIRGVTKTVELRGSLLGSGLDPWGNERVALELRGEIDRKDFGLTWNQALETGGVLVSDRVRIELALAAVREA